MQAKTGVIYLQKDRFQIYSPYLPNILEFRFVPELIHDFDLISKDLLENLIKVFVINNKIPASGLIIVIADNASFMKDFVTPPINPMQPPASPPPTLEDLQSMATQYLEHIPFEVVASKTFPLPSGVRAYATNQEVFESIKAILEKHGFIIQAVIPGFAFGPQVGNLATIDGATIGLILQKLSMVRAFNLLSDSGAIEEAPVEESSIGESAKDEEPEPEHKNDSPKQNNKMVLAIAISAIAIIIIVTGVILYMQFTAVPYKPPPPAEHPAASAATAPSQPTQAPVQAAEATGIVQAKDITVQIINASASAQKAQALQTAFIPHGFKSVTLQTQESLSTAQGILIFSPRVSQDIRTSVTADVKNTLGNVLVQDKTDATFDIVVILGK